MIDRHDRIEAALRACLEWIELNAEDVSYGFFPGGDPREFHPDPESSTEEEREAHRLACEAAESGEKTNESPACQWLVSEDGQSAAVVTHGKFGLGTYTVSEPQLVALRDACRKALEEP
jgi:hypothetical protein